MRDARARVRKAASDEKLAADLTLAACRHGGLTELGNAELTEQGVMALNGHKTPQAARSRNSSPQTPRMDRKQPKR